MHYRLRSVAALVLALTASSAMAVSPPMETDDPDTPPDGRWEINIGAISTREHDETEVELPVMDINYGLGDHLQLKLEAPLTHLKESGSEWRSGLGSIGVGVKWRFIDEKTAGFNMSVYPQFSSGWNTLSGRHSLADPGEQLFLPVEASIELGNFGLVGEIGRNFNSAGPEQWAGGVVLTHKCGEKIECMAELRETVNPHDVQSLVNFGLNWELSDTYALMAAVGREFGPEIDEQARSRIYFGIQINK
jgi:hypothetical protein